MAGWWVFSPQFAAPLATKPTKKQPTSWQPRFLSSLTASQLYRSPRVFGSPSPTQRVTCLKLSLDLCSIYAKEYIAISDQKCWKPPSGTFEVLSTGTLRLLTRRYCRSVTSSNLPELILCCHTMAVGKLDCWPKIVGGWAKMGCATFCR